MAFGDKPNSQDPQQMAQTMGLLQAALAVNNANQNGGRMGDMMLQGLAGYTQGAGGAYRFNMESEKAAAAQAAQSIKVQMELEKYRKETQANADREHFIASLPPQQAALARANPKYLDELVAMHFAPQKSAINVQEHMGKNGMFWNPYTQKMETTPGYADAQGDIEGSKARARGMNTPVAVQQGGSVVMPGMVMGGQGGGQAPAAFPQSGVSPAMLDAVRTVESGGNPNAVSPKGAQGPYQFMPGTAKQYGVENPFDEGQSRTGAERYLDALMRRYNGNPHLALMAYNGGEGNVDAWLRTGKRLDGSDMPAETLQYPGKVLGQMSRASSQGQTQGQTGQGANPPGVLFQGMNANTGIQETEEQKQYGGSLVKQYDKVVEDAGAASSLLQNLHLAKRLPVDTGALAPLKNTVAAYAEAWGINPQKIGLDRAANAQAVTGVLQNIVLDKMQAQKGPQTENDAKRIEQTVANLGHTPEAYRYLMDVAVAIEQRKVDKAAFYDEFREQHGTFNGVAKAWREHEKKNPLSAMVQAPTPQKRETAAGTSRSGMGGLSGLSTEQLLREGGY